MNMLRLLLVLLAIRKCLSAYEEFPKCCGSDSVLRKNNSVYNCTKNVDLRLGMVTNNTNFLEAFEEGLCIDIDNGIALFRLNGSEVIKEKELDVPFYPKCCPIDYFYNAATHACVRSSTKLNIFFDHRFVKVGLPHCRIIEDIKIENKNLERVNGTLHLFQQNRKYDDGFYCVDKDENDSFIARICQNGYDVCSRTKCVHKCCQDGQSFVNGSKCQNTYVHGLDFSSFSKVMDDINGSFAIIHGHTRPMYLLNQSMFEYHLGSDGIFKQKEIDQAANLGNVKVTQTYNVQENVYCIEHTFKESANMDNYYFFREFSMKNSKSVKFQYTQIAMAISCVFLAMTIVYYCVSNEKRTVFGKTLISFCLSSFMAFLLLSIFASVRPNRKTCNVVAFMIFYFTVSTFAWMNTLCIDIYWTFGSPKSFSSRHQRSKELKRLIFYSLYGWGLPIILTGLVIVFDYLQVLPSKIQITVNDKKCFIDRNYGQFLFLTTPLAVFECCNLILFIRTVTNCIKVKREINKMNDSHSIKGDKKQKLDTFKDRFGLLLKLFLIMGISFLFEVASTFYNFKKNETTTIIEIIWDTFNSLQGFFIFVIFIVKKRIFKKFQKKVGLKKSRKISLISSAVTQTTTLPTISNKH